MGNLHGGGGTQQQKGEFQVMEPGGKTKVLSNLHPVDNQKDKKKDWLTKSYLQHRQVKEQSNKKLLIFPWTHPER